jgi:penicillin amidase
MRFAATFLLLVITVLFTSPYRSQSQSKRTDLRERAQAALAQTSGEIKIKGLEKNVYVIRDEWGIAHIYAETQRDLFLAQGFVAAQDRLWQMDLWRRIGEGKVSEIVGEKGVERDRFARLLRYRGDLRAEYESYAPDAKEIIESFVRGVNEYIETVRDRLPIEFELTGTRPEPWTPEVCLTRMAGFVMTRNSTTEIQRAQLALQYGKEFVDEWMETEPDRKLEIPSGLDLAGLDAKVLAAATAAGSPVVYNPSDGSNNWVIDGTMSATGKPLLANDPHRTIALPSLRYMVHLVGPGWNVIGAGEPALPGVAAGHNERVGFGFTIVGIDQQDLYIEEINPANPREYRSQGKWRRMRIERDSIKVKGEAAPRELELKFTHHGPVIYEDPSRNRAVALRWVGSEPGTAGYLASLSLNRAQNWKEFLKAMDRWKVPSENLIYADVEGNIGWVAAGLTPIRKGWSGLIPVPGNSGQYEWQGFLPVSKLPQSYNPAAHFIATANHNIMPPGYKTELGYEWANPIRFWRITEALKGAKGKLDVADFQKLQYDELSIPARELTGILKEIKGASPELQPFYDLLTRWDAVLSKDSAAAALYEVWVRKLPVAVFKSHIPAAAWPMVEPRIPLLKLIDALKNPSARWFGSAGRSGRDAAMLQSLADAVTEAKNRFGQNPAEWRWGKLHLAPFKHQLSTSPELSALLDLQSVEKGGDANTVHNTSGTGYRQNHGASFREILDVSDWDRSVATNVPGQSGQPGSRHYGDLLPLWAEGRYFPLLYSKQKIEAGAKQRLTLTP